MILQSAADRRLTTSGSPDYKGFAIEAGIAVALYGGSAVATRVATSDFYVLSKTDQRILRTHVEGLSFTVGLGVDLATSAPVGVNGK